MNQVLLNILLFTCLVNCYERTFSACNDYKLLNGKMKINKRKMAKFQCNKGYTLAGEKYNFCIRGRFDIPPPVCVKPTCQTDKQLTNGLIFLSYNGGVMNFYCKAGYTMRGSNISYCDGNRWSHNLPACISTHTPLATSCDFETEDLCGWSHDLNYNFEWRRQNLQTPSGHIGTGPRFDHTLGPNNTGYYMYVESSSRLENDTARLISPLFPAFPRGLCVEFWYHMFGKDMGTLRVYLRKEIRGSVINIRENLQLVWNQTGNQGDVWRLARIDIPQGITYDFQIIFDGIRGKSHISDLAIDDVQLLDFCQVDDIFTSTTELIETDEPEFGSCANRCYENSSEIILGDSSSCECNDQCYERNTCCPDYTIVCLMINFDETTTDFSELFESEFTSLPTTKTTETSKTTIKVTETPKTTTKTTESPKTTIKITETPKTTTKITEAPRTTTKTTATPRTTTKTTATPRTTTKTTATPRTTTKTTATPKTIEITTKTTETPRTTKKTTKIPTTTLKTTAKPTQKTTKKLTTLSKTTITTTTSQPTEKTTETIVIPTLQIETDYNVIVTTQNESNIQMQKKEKIIRNETTSENSSNNVVILSICGLVALCVAVAGTLLIKYYRICHRLKLRNLRTSDSMSDVRFLASDEVLDFTWRNSE